MARLYRRQGLKEQPAIQIEGLRTSARLKEKGR
jgi:hypothetical protein